MSAAALVRARGEGGVVTIVADASIPTVQSLIRWDPVGHAEADLAARTEVGLPPSVHMAAVDGTAGAVTALLDEARLPEQADVLGPVDCRRACAARRASRPGCAPIRCWCGSGASMASPWRRRYAAAWGSTSARQTHEPARVQIDPLHVG